MELPKRFAVSTMLLLMLVVASIFGYAQWRRLQLKAEIAELNKLGEFTLTMPNSSFQTRTLSTLLVKDGFWPTVYPDSVTVIGKANGIEGYVFGGNNYAVGESKAYLNHLEARLRAVGVKEFSVKVLVPRENGFSFESIPDVGSLK